jgi:hypothetical protein
MSTDLSIEAHAALAAREEGKARGFYTTKTFAAAIGRGSQWVSQRCKARVIKTLPGGKPYRIPLSEEARFNGL